MEPSKLNFPVYFLLLATNVFQSTVATINQQCTVITSFNYRPAVIDSEIIIVSMCCNVAVNLCCLANRMRWNCGAKFGRRARTYVITHGVYVNPSLVQMCLNNPHIPHPRS